MSETVVTSPTPETPSSEDVAAFNRHLKGYLFIGGLQVIFTFLAVILSFAIVGTRAKIVCVLLAAAINASIVAGIQMHLKHEKALIWRFLFLTGIFFAAMFFLSLLHWYDPITGSHIHH